MYNLEIAKSVEKDFRRISLDKHYNKSFFNPKSKRSYNVHTDPKHGGPHVDISKRGSKSTYKPVLKQN